jgi:hypothetical protein
MLLSCIIWECFFKAQQFGYFHSMVSQTVVRVPLSFRQTSFTGRLRLNCNGTCAETRFRLSTKRTSPFKSAGASVQSTTSRRAVHVSLQGSYCSCKLVFCSHVTLTGYPLHSVVSLSLLLPCVTVCHHISNPVYAAIIKKESKCENGLKF